MLWNREISNKCMTTIYEVYLKSLLIKMPKHEPLQREAEEKSVK
jgi:hypothetical protein